MTRHILAVLFLLILSFWSIRPLLSSGFFPMHDDTQVARVVVMGRALRNGQFPVRWVSDLGYGYGYPIFNFYGPLPYYVGGALYALGVDGLTATKIMIGIGFVGAGVAMYALGSSVFGTAGGVLAAVYYLYAPYHAVQLWVRGDIGEFWALIFLPLIMLGFWELRTWPKQKRGLLVGGLGLAGVILSHTILGYVTAVFTAMALGIYWLVALSRGNFNRPRFLADLTLLAFGLGLSAFFWLPAMAEMRFTGVAAQIGTSANFRDHFVCLSQLWNSPWGFGGSAPGCIDGLSFMLGKIYIVMALLAGLIWWLKRRNLKSRWRIAAAGVAITLVSIFFTLSTSVKLWEIIPLMAYLQYPWRFLAFSIFGLSLLAGCITLVGRSGWQRWMLILPFVLVVIFVESKYFAPQYSYNRPAAAFETEAELRYRISRISDEYLPPQIVRPSTVGAIVHDTIKAPEGMLVDTEIDTETYLKSHLISPKAGEIVIERAYFPGWYYWVNGQPVVPVLTAGVPVLTVPAGNNVVEAHFVNTPVRTAANLISLIALCLIIYYYGRKTIA